MKFIFAVFLVSLFPTDPGKIGEVNKVKSEARKAYISGDYKKAIAQYRYLADSLDVMEDEIMLNLANSYFQTNDTTHATATYESLIGSPKPVIRSKAQQQLGVLNYRQGKLQEALNNFKQAIKADANNIDARYNYEMLKKKLEEQQKQDQNQQNKDQKKKDQQNQDQQKKDQQQKEDQQKKEQEKKDQEKKEQEKKNQEQQKKEQQEKDQKSNEQKEKSEEEQRKEQKENEDKDKKESSKQLSEKLQQMKISEEKAKMILEAMKNQEIQYLQQNKRKATKSRDKTKPDW